MKNLYALGLLLFTLQNIPAQDLKELPTTCLIGPYLTAQMENKTPVIKARWHTVPNQMGEIEFGPTQQLGKSAKLPSSRAHEFTVQNGESSDFFYRVKGPNGWSPIFQYQKPSEGLSFLILADMQDGDMKPPRRWADVAKSAYQKARESHSSFLVLLGDLPEDDYPGYWKLFFDRGQELLASFPSFSVPGNHDSLPGKGNRGKLDRYLEYFPGPLYQGFKWGTVSWLLLNTEVTARGLLSEDPDQVDFSNQFLGDHQSSPWVLSGFHYPPYHALDRHQDSVALTREFTQYFDGKVDFVFSGHVHAYQRTRPVLFEGGIQDAYGRSPGQGPGYIVLPPAGNWPEPYSRMGGVDEGADLVAWPTPDSKGRFSGNKSDIGFVLVKAEKTTLEIQVWGHGDLELRREAPLRLMDQVNLKK